LKSTVIPAVRLSLPATSANLGPGFDAIGLALSMHLTVEAHSAAAFTIEATGRDAELCASLENNLILDTYRDVLTRANKTVTPLHLKLHNEIPLGMGCGSSAAALCAGVALANHFGRLHMDDAAIVAEATRLEGHPDNVAACWLGGFTVSAAGEDKDDADTVLTSTFPGDPTWQILLAIQPSSLATKKARALLPATYTRADAVFNVQRSSLLVAAFAQNRLDLLRTAMQDRIHQPYREDACPLLKQLLPLAAEPELAGIALSGAGPSVLIVLSEDTTPLAAETRLRAILDPTIEILSLRIGGPATTTLL
jgi:homoserine kinase